MRKFWFDTCDLGLKNKVTETSIYEEGCLSIPDTFIIFLRQTCISTCDVYRADEVGISESEETALAWAKENTHQNGRG